MAVKPVDPPGFDAKAANDAWLKKVRKDDGSAYGVVYVNVDDQEKGIAGDPNNCMFSVACKRAFGSQGVLFYPTVAYVDMIDPDDPERRIVMRFMLPLKTRERLEQFDEQATSPNRKFSEATFRLRKVSPGQRLEYMAKKSRQQRRRNRRLKMDQALSMATTEKPTPKKKSESAKGAATKQHRALMGIRSGTGRIHTREED